MILGTAGEDLSQGDLLTIDDEGLVVRAKIKDPDPLAHVRWTPPTDPRDLAQRAMNKAEREYWQHREELYGARCRALGLEPGRTIVEFRDAEGQVWQGAVKGVSFHDDHSFSQLTVRTVSKRVRDRLTGRTVIYFGPFSEMKILRSVIAVGGSVIDAPATEEED